MSKNIPEDVNEEVTRINDTKLVKTILREAGIDERHPARDVNAERHTEGSKQKWT